MGTLPLFPSTAWQFPHVFSVRKLHRYTSHGHFEHKFSQLCLALETDKLHTYLLWKDRPNLTNFNLTKLFLMYQRKSSSKTSFQLTDLSSGIRNQSDLVSVTHPQCCYAKPSQAEKGDNGSLVNVSECHGTSSLSTAAKTFASTWLKLRLTISSYPD